MLGTDLLAVGGEPVRGRHVRLVVDLEQARRIEAIGGEDAAAALQAAALGVGAHAVGHQGRDDRVAGERGDRPAVEGEVRGAAGGR